MNSKTENNIKYSIFNPTGNITALVETRVDTGRQPEVADEIMRRHPEVEQVGFVYFEPRRPVPVLLRMAGGEFCGNAAMSAAALYSIRTGDESSAVMVSVSGAARPLEVRLKRGEGGLGFFEAGVEMPAPISIEKTKLTAEGISEELPVVNMGGISHIVAEDSKKLYALKDEPERAEQVIKEWCTMLGADCLGIMFMSGSGSAVKSRTDGGKKSKSVADIKLETEIIPLVYVPGADTIFWENSCASGSAAAGMYLSDKYGAAVEAVMKEPAGTLMVRSDVREGGTWLYGSTELTAEDAFDF